jgi:hypothetical protein
MGVGALVAWFIPASIPLVGYTQAGIEAFVTFSLSLIPAVRHFGPRFVNGYYFNVSERNTKP